MATFFAKVVGIQNGHKGSLFCTPKKINEVRYEDLSGVDYIKVESGCADVRIISANKDTLGANLTGDVSSNGEITLEVSKNGNTITVEVKHTGTTIKGKLNLYLGISNTMFKKLKVEGSNSTIFVEKGIKAKSVVLDSANGNITFLGDSPNIKAEVSNGNIDLYIDAKSDVTFTAESTNGNIDVRLRNISECKVDASTVFGSIQRFYTCDGAYKVSGSAETSNGDITLRNQSL